MGATIIRPRTHEKIIERRLSIYVKDSPGSGFSFPCDENGNIKFDPKYEKAQRDSYNYAIASDKFDPPFIEKRITLSLVPALALCECGNEILLEDQYCGACSCPHCGQWYNMFGNSLKDPKYWYDDEYDD